MMNTCMLSKNHSCFLKENINFEYMEHWLIKDDIITTKEIEDYITQEKAIHFRSERLLKWLIWKRKCKAFVLLLDEMRCDNHIPEEIARQINNNLRETQSSLTGNASILLLRFSVSNGRLHCYFLSFSVIIIESVFFRFFCGFFFCLSLF